MAEISPNWSQLYSNTGIRFGANPGLNALNQRYQLYQQQRAQDAAMFAKNIAGINFGGVKPADADVLRKQYGDILNTYGQMRSTTDPKKYSELAMDLRIKQGQMGYDVARLQEENKALHQSAEIGQHSPDVSEGWFDKWNKVYNTPTDAQGYTNQKSDLLNTMKDKPIDIDKVGNGFIKELTNVQKNSGQPFRDPTTGLYVTPFRTVTTLDKDALTDKFANWAVGNEKSAHRLMDRFGVSTGHELAQLLSDKYYASVKDKLGEQIKTDKGELSFAQREELMRNQAILRSMYPTFAQAESTKPTPAQILGDAMKNGIPGSGEKFLQLVPKGTYYPGEHPVIGRDDATGEFIFTFPRQAIKTNGKHRPESVYKLNPNSPDFHSQFAQMAADQHINLETLNKIEGVKGHGQIPEAQRHGTNSPPKVTNQDEYNKLPKGAQYIAPDGRLHIKS